MLNGRLHDRRRSALTAATPATPAANPFAGRIIRLARVSGVTHSGERIGEPQRSGAFDDLLHRGVACSAGY